MDITKIYNLIINSKNNQETFKNNIEIWKEFYENRNLIIKNNIQDQRLYIIIKFLLEQEKGEIFEYFHSNLLDLLIFEEKNIIFKTRNKYSNNNNNSIDTIINISNFHNELSNSLKKIKLKDDDITKSSINKYQSDSLKFDCIESLIIVIHQSFFELNPELVIKLIKYIETETKILTEKKQFNEVDINFIYQYAEKFLPILQYTGNDITKNSIINKILNGGIKNKKIILKFINTVNTEALKVLLNNDLTIFLNILSTLDNEEDKFQIIDKLINKFLTEDNFHILLNYYIKNNNEAFNKCLTKSNLNQLIKYANTASLERINLEIIYYLLDNNYTMPIFIYNLNELINTNQNKFSKEETEIIKEKLKKYQSNETINYSFEESIKLFDEYLDEKILLTKEQTFQIIKSITKELNRNLGLEEIGIYFVESEKYNGEFYKKNNIKGINLNLDLIRDFLLKSQSLEKRIQILITVLHELQHHIQFSKNNITNIDEYQNLKEKYLEKYDFNYYENNYKSLIDEIEARIESYQMTAKFFERFLPNHLNKVQDSIIRELNEELNYKKFQEKYKTYEIINKEEIDINLAFDILIKYNPKILIEEPIFNIEYNKDGTPKTLEEILMIRNEENKELIDKILEEKYQYKNIKNQLK